MMHGFYHDAGGGWWVFMMVFMAIFWISVIVVIVWALARLLPDRREPSQSHERAETILDRRLAAGEIDVKTYDELRAKLRAPAEKS
jgi:putative membrane protein